MHWYANKLYPCTECGECPYCPGRPDKTCFRWYGAAAEFSQELHVPTDEEQAMAKLRWRTWVDAGRNGQEPPQAAYAFKTRATTGFALAEIPDAEIVGLGDGERRGMVLEWSKGPHKNSVVKVKVLGRWTQSLIDEFDWLVPAERILNGGRPIRIPQAEVKDQNILKFQARKQA